MLKSLLAMILFLALALGCAPRSEPAPATPEPAPTTAAPTPAGTTPEEEPVADVISVDTSGSPGDYQFSVEVESPDQGCGRYSDWWEVVTEDGELIYRRVMLHDHTNEQPFARTGGPVEIDADTVVIVRAHMHPTGYGGQVMRGSVEEGFTSEQGDPRFARDLRDVKPLPPGCAF